MRLFTLSLFLLLNTLLFAQNQPSNGVAKSKVSTYFLQHVTLFVSPTEMLENVSVLIENGKIKETIEMSKKLAAGTYYLGLYQDNKAVVKQFVKE